MFDPRKKDKDDLASIPWFDPANTFSGAKLTPAKSGTPAEPVKKKRGFTNVKVSLFLIIACCIVYPFGWENNSFACSYDNLFVYGKWWTVITAIFTHGSIGHLLGNMAFLLLFGVSLENRVGHTRFFLIFITGGVISMFLSVFYYAHNQPSVGASGAIATLLATLMVINPWLLSYLFGLIPLPIGITGLTFCLMNIAGFFHDHFHPPQGTVQVAYFAHLIGFVVGIIIGTMLTPAWKKNLVICVIQYICYYFILKVVMQHV